MYDILRTQPKIAILASKALSKNLDPKEFPFAGDQKTKKDTARNAKWSKKDEELNQERLIINVIGGLSHYEICAV